MYSPTLDVGVLLVWKSLPCCRWNQSTTNGQRSRIPKTFTDKRCQTQLMSWQRLSVKVEPPLSVLSEECRLSNEHESPNLRDPEFFFFFFFFFSGAGLVGWLVGWLMD